MRKIIKSLETIRKEKGFTQEQMAIMLCIAVSTYNQYETGKRNVPNDIAARISEILGESISNIFLPKKFTVSKSEFISKEVPEINRNEN